MLTETQRQAARMVFKWRAGLTGESLQDIAAAAGVHRCTLWRWTKQREFRREVQRHKRNEEKRLARLCDKGRAELQQRVDAALQEWENRIDKYAKVISSEAKLCGDRPSKRLLDAEKALYNTLNRDPLRGIIPREKYNRHL